MTPDELRSLQAPLKTRYRDDPDSARWTLTAEGSIDADLVTCTVDAGFGVARAGLHAATGGDGSTVCSGDMLLQALVACAGVTLAAVATALGITFRHAAVQAEGDLDFRGTLGVDRSTPVGFSAIRLQFIVDSDAGDDALANLLKLTERYCVVFQTLAKGPSLSAKVERTQIGAKPSST